MDSKMRKESINKSLRKKSIYEMDLDLTKRKRERILLLNYLWSQHIFTLSIELYSLG